VNTRLIEENSERSFDLREISILGRSADCTIQIDNSGVSRKHAMIRLQVDGFWFFDLGSFNGSYINDVRVTTAQRLMSGDRVALSHSTFRFEENDANERTPLHGFDAASTIPDIRTGDVLVLVTDIQGFSSLSEHLSPDELAPIIGSWYSHTEEILAQHGATLDKFIGDCALAYWTQTNPDHRLLALSAAGAMQAASAEAYASHQELLDQAGIKFKTGVALHRGRVAHGGMSSREFTILGDAVNVAFRMEALTRQLESQIVTSAEFLDGWPEGEKYCRPLGNYEVKGRVGPVEIFAIEHLPSDGSYVDRV
jgi:adenylate cyclase